MADTRDRLADRAAVTDIVTAYAMALDARDWTLFRSIFQDEVAIDYGSLGSIQATLPAEEWVARCRVLGAFDATQHKVGNFVCAFDGETARVTSYVDAAHFIGESGQILAGYALGAYVHDLVRSAGGWKIGGCRFTLIGHPGGRDMFDRVFALARAAFALGNPPA